MHACTLYAEAFGVALAAGRTAGRMTIARMSRRGSGYCDVCVCCGRVGVCGDMCSISVGWLGRVVGGGEMLQK